MNKIAVESDVRKEKSLFANGTNDREVYPKRWVAVLVHFITECPYMMYRLIFTLTLFCFTASAQSSLSFNPQCDVDSIGNLWVFTVDKSGSMLSERIAYTNHHWSPQRIKNDVITRLSREGGILDQID